VGRGIGSADQLRLEALPISDGTGKAMEQELPPICKCGFEMISSEEMVAPDFERPTFRHEAIVADTWNCVFGVCREIFVKKNGGG